MNALLEWLGAGGKPVEHWKAEARARVCEICPCNVQPRWWEMVLKDPIARAIREMLSVKQGMDLRLSQDESLGMCKICGCATPLKVWTPMVHIQADTKPDVMAKYPDHCWIPNELNP